MALAVLRPLQDYLKHSTPSSSTCRERSKTIIVSPTLLKTTLTCSPQTNSKLGAFPLLLVLLFFLPPLMQGLLRSKGCWFQSEGDCLPIEAGGKAGAHRSAPYGTGCGRSVVGCSTRVSSNGLAAQPVSQWFQAAASAASCCGDVRLLGCIQAIKRKSPEASVTCSLRVI